MNSKHTPGPWKAAMHSGYHAVTNEQNGSTHTVVPMVYGDGGDEAEANAALIAAAPDGYALAVLVAQWFVDAKPGTDEGRIRADALAKAEGKQ